MRSLRAALAGGAAVLLAAVTGGGLPEAHARPPAAETAKSPRNDKDKPKGDDKARRDDKSKGKGKGKGKHKGKPEAKAEAGQKANQREAADRTRDKADKRDKHDKHAGHGKAGARAATHVGGATRVRSGSRTVAQPHPGAAWTEARSPAATLTVFAGPIHCPPEMVAVAGRVCVDRWEGHLVDASSGAVLSPYYPPQRETAAALFDQWSRARDLAPETALSHFLALPAPWTGGLPPPPYTPRAVSAAGVVPSGYTNGLQAAEACRVAGKRLCTEGEWRTACRGEAQTQFPYGTTYRQDACNVFREAHPSALLHGNASLYHDDPRLNALAAEGAPLLRTTGTTPSCGSRWGDDVIWDMVGNLDEWIDDPEGTFLGGFYSRATRQGCEAKIAGHPIDYFDYSLGVRCCKDPG